jgi:hypothetical protein
VPPGPQVQFVCATLPSSDQVPSGQAVHSALPTEGLYVPATHKLHDCASGPVSPAGHPAPTQSSRASLPIGELAPAGHAVHNTLPCVGLYVPVSQAVHGPPFDPVNPRLHVQSTDRKDPVADVQLLAGQVVHTGFPSTQYVPCAQTVHGPPSGPVNPRLHLQSVSATFTSPNVQLPAGQVVHTAFPVTALYFPSAQTVHVPPFGPVYP